MWFQKDGATYHTPIGFCGYRSSLLTPDATPGYNN